MRPRSDPGKLAIAVRLRNETTWPAKWVAAWVQIGTAKGAKSVLHRSGRGQHQDKLVRTDESCAQLDFQSTAEKGGEHPAVLISHPDICARSAVVNVLFCTNQRQSRRPYPNEVTLTLSRSWVVVVSQIRRGV